jgi:hypothetical protein
MAAWGLAVGLTLGRGAPATLSRADAQSAPFGMRVEKRSTHPVFPLRLVHGLYKWKSVRPVIPTLGQQPYAHGIAPGHQAAAVVLNLVNPVRPGRRFVGG